MKRETTSGDPATIWAIRISVALVFFLTGLDKFLRDVSRRRRYSFPEAAGCLIFDSTAWMRVRARNMSTRFGFIPLSLFVATACATSNVQPNRPRDRIVATTEESVIRAPGDLASTAIINATPEAVYDVLQVVYLELGVEVKTLDPDSRVVGNKRFQKMYRLGGSSLDTYMGCGLSATGPVANNSRLTMSLISQVVPGKSGSELRTVFSGYAEDLSVSKGAMSCGSTGKLEERIQELVRDHLGK